MFSKEDMLIPVTKAEAKVRNVKEDCEYKLREQRTYYSKIVNDMKLNHPIKTRLKGPGGVYEVGTPTPFYTPDGLRLFLGDEVAMEGGPYNGELGIIVYGFADKYRIRISGKEFTLKEDDRSRGSKTKWLKDPLVHQYVFVTSCRITRHFNNYKIGDNVAGFTTVIPLIVGGIDYVQ